MQFRLKAHMVDPAWGTKDWIGWADRDTSVLKGTKGQIISICHSVDL